MTDERRRLIEIVWTWDSVAIGRNLDPEKRRGIWRVLDTLYNDLAIARTPGSRECVRTVLNGMKQTPDVLAVRKELGL